MTGYASSAFKELDIAMRQFMKFRCVGAGALAVSLNGRRVYKRGFGRMRGPAAAPLPGCQISANDPLQTFPDSAWQYSNMGASILGRVIEHLSGNRYAADVGEPETHDGSEIDIFLQHQLGIEHGVDTEEGWFGIEKAHAVPGYVNPGPQPRIWSGEQQDYFKLAADSNRPFYVYYGQEVIKFDEEGNWIPSSGFNQWLQGSVDEINVRPTWSFQAPSSDGFPLVPLRQSKGGQGASTGSIQAEPPVMLTLINKYAVGKDNSAMAISTGDGVYAWYADGKVSVGSSTNLDAYAVPYAYRLPPGQTPFDVVGIAINSVNRVYSLYRDGTRAIGTSSDLDAYGNSSFTMNADHSPDDIRGIGIDSANDDHVYTLFSDGSHAEGSSWNLNLYDYTPGKITDKAISSDEESQGSFVNKPPI